MSNTSSQPPQSPLLNRYVPAFLLILAALGVPPAFIIAFRQFVTTYPWLALVLGIVYEVAIIFLSFIGQIWQSLQPRWVNRITDWADNRIQEMVSGYLKQYKQFLFYLHRDFDVMGLSIRGSFTPELDQVFVELSIDPRAIQKASSNPLQVPSDLQEGSHSIWDYLAATALNNQHLVILGPPGSGKTTLLKHITLCLVAHSHPQQFHHNLSRQLPILLFLREHTNAIQATADDYTLVEALDAHLKKWGRPLPPPEWLKRRLSRGECLILLDGLDEVADPQARQEVVNWVRRQMGAYPTNRFIVTSRPFGFQNNPLENVSVTVLEVRSFTPEQIERFVHNWYLANEIMSKQKDDPGVRMKARAEAKKLLQRIRITPVLHALAVNPLLLTMMTTVHYWGNSLPDKRVDLYAEICEVFLGKRQKARGQTLELSPAQLQSVLQPLAYHMMLTEKVDIVLAEAQDVIKEPLAYVSAQQSTQISPQYFLQLVERVSGLLLEQESGLYRFAHLTFQEYLAAVHIRDKKLEQRLVSQVDTSWWHETIRLYCAQADATPIIAACLGSAIPSVQALTLAIECQQEALKLQPAVKNQLDSLLEQGVGVSNPDHQDVVASALLKRRLREMASLNETTSVATSLITCTEYQIFLDEQRKQGKYYQPDHWTDTHFSTELGRTSVLGVRQVDAQAFCSWLTEWDKSLWQYRLPRADEQAQIRNEGILASLEAGIGYWLYEDTGFARTKPMISTQKDSILNYISTVRDIDRSRVRARDLDLDLTRVSAFDLDLSRAFDPNRAFGLPYAFDLDLSCAFDPSHTFDLDISLNRDLDRTLAIVRTLNRDLDLVCTRISDFNSTLDLAHALHCDFDLIRTLNRDLDLASRDPDLANRDPDLAYALNRGFACLFNRDLDLASRDPDLASRDPDLAYALNRGFACPLDLDFDLIHTLNRELDLTNRDPDLAYALNRGLACSLNRDLDLIHTLNLAFDLAHVLNRSLACTLDLARTLNRSSNLVFDLDFVLYLDLDLDLAHARDHAHDLARALAFAFVRTLILLRNHYQNLLSSTLRNKDGKKSRSHPSETEELQKIIQDTLDYSLSLYLDLIIVQGRREGKLPAFEGILLVREQKDSGQMK